MFGPTLIVLALLGGVPMTSPSHPWFKGPTLGGVTVSNRPTNGCLRQFAPVNPAALEAWKSLRGGKSLDVLMPGSKFAGYTLRRGPRYRVFCLNMFNVAFPEAMDMSDHYAMLPPYIEGVQWALDVFATAGLEIEPPGWTEEFGPERKTWPGVVRWLRTLKSANIKTYDPASTIAILEQWKLPVPPDLREEADAWRREGRTR